MTTPKTSSPTSSCFSVIVIFVRTLRACYSGEASAEPELVAPLLVRPDHHVRSVGVPSVVIVPDSVHLRIIGEIDVEAHRMDLPVPKGDPWVDHPPTIIWREIGCLDQSLVGPPSEVADHLIPAVPSLDASRSTQQVIARRKCYRLWSHSHRSEPAPSMLWWCISFSPERLNDHF